MSTVDIFEIENKFRSEGYEVIVGIDEAGRGPLAGPVVACACAWRGHEIENKKQYELIKDSKKISEKQREKLYDFIQENFHVGVGICDCVTIDRVNILEATYLAMRKAVGELNSNIKNCHPRVCGDPVQRLTDTRLDSRLHGNDNVRQIILVDGNKTIPNLSIEQRAIVGGDNFVKSISAASIIAKVTRDRMMQEAHTKFPQYNFAKHKGYGTAEHMTALKKHGPCEIHRKSFRPVREAIEMYRLVISNF